MNIRRVPHTGRVERGRNRVLRGPNHLSATMQWGQQRLGELEAVTPNVERGNRPMYELVYPASMREANTYDFQTDYNTTETWDVTLPASLAVGDLLVVSCFVDNFGVDFFPQYPVLSMTAGWTRIHNPALAAYYGEGLWVRQADADDVAGSNTHTLEVDNDTWGSETVGIVGGESQCTAIALTSTAVVDTAGVTSTTVTGSETTPTAKTHVSPSTGDYALVIAWNWTRTLAFTGNVDCVSPTNVLGTTDVNNDHELSFGYGTPGHTATANFDRGGASGDYHGGIATLPTAG